MRARTLMTMALAAGLAVTGCQTERSEEMALDETGVENREAVDHYRADARARLGEIDIKIQQLRARADSSAASVRADLTALLEEFQSRSGMIAQRLETLPYTDDESWNSLKGQVDKSLDSLRQDVDRAFEGDTSRPRPDADTVPSHR
ncbi:MAG TPA: hypothetical protein VFH97_04845 [Gemmatimonadales bacterium]|nr:hypothetical protein [Gemmatimonadales bacterium]